MTATLTPAAPAPAAVTGADWTLPVCQAVHALLDLAMKRPHINPGPWVVSFTRDGAPHINYRWWDAPATSVLISEPGWYRFIWGPKLQNLARYLWEYLAADVALLGVHVTVPTDEQVKAMYWGPMPGEGFHWGMPGIAYTAMDARDRYVQTLTAAWPDITALAWDTPKRRPYQEEIDARHARAIALEPGPAVTPVPSAPQPCSWQPGSWGKGFLSATGRRYTWMTDHPSAGGRPQHSDRQSLIAQVESDAVLEAGRMLTNVENVGYLSPIVIAPDGYYTQDSADVFWKANVHLGAEHDRQLAQLAERFDAAAFAGQGGLKYTRDRDRWTRRSYDAHPAR